MAEPRAPAGLGATGAFAVALRILVDACREADIVDRLEATLADAELMVKGSMGQLVASPLVRRCVSTAPCGPAG
jgi:hypothetical protein